MVCKNCGRTVELRRKAAPAAEAPVPQPSQPGETPGFVPYSPPAEKAKIGGWLLAFVIFNAGYMVYNIGSVIYSSIVTAQTPMVGAVSSASIIFSILLTLVLYVFPPAVMLYHVHERSLKYKGWYTGIMIINIVMTVIGVISLVITIVSMPMLTEMAADPAMQAQGVVIPEINMPSLIVSMVVSVLLMAVHIAFFVYLRKSKRVAETFDPRNNPPKQ